MKAVARWSFKSLFNNFVFALKTVFLAAKGSEILADTFCIVCVFFAFFAQKYCFYHQKKVITQTLVNKVVWSNDWKLGWNRGFKDSSLDISYYI